MGRPKKKPVEIESVEMQVEFAIPRIEELRLSSPQSEVNLVIEKLNEIIRKFNLL